MKCDYCKFKENCTRKWYQCDRQLVPNRKGEYVCVSKETYDKIRLKERKREYNQEEKVVFLGYVFNRVKQNGYGGKL